MSVASQKDTTAPPLRPLYACLLFSGAAGLSYEVLWTRLLARAFGSTAWSFAAVLAVFFGGLAVGAWLAGRRAGGIERPARVYGLLEVGAGLYAMLSYPLLVRLDQLFVVLDPGAGLALGVTVRVLVSVVLLFPPTILLGATLPVLARLFAASDDRIGSGLARLYGVNTLGGFLGAYLISFWLMPMLGLFGGLAVSALFSLVAALVALRVDRGLGDAAPAVPEPAPAGGPRPTWPLLALAAVSGLVSISGEVVWSRLLTLVLEGTIYGVGSVLAAYLGGLGLGSVLVARVLDRDRDLGLIYGLLLLGGSAALVWLAPLLPWLQAAVDAYAGGGGLLAQHARLLGALLILLPSCVAFGAALPVLIRLLVRPGHGPAQALGTVYAVNTVAAILASLAAGFVLVPWIGSSATLRAGLGLGAVGAVAAVLLLGRVRRLRRAVALGLVAAVAFGAAPELPLAELLWVFTPPPRADDHNPLHTARQRQIDFAARTLSLEEGYSSVVNVQNWGPGGERVMFIDGMPQGGINPNHGGLAVEGLLVGALPALHHPAPRRALVVGLGAGTTAAALQRLGLSEIRVIELEPAVSRAVARVFGDQPSPLSLPGVRVDLGDARHELLLAAHRQDLYDVITSQPQNPWLSGSASLFTRETFQRAHDALADGGIFCQWIFLGRMDEASLRAIVRSFVEVFPDCLLYYFHETQNAFLIGAKGGFRIDAASASQRWEASGLGREGAPDAVTRGDLFDLWTRLLGSWSRADKALPPPPANDEDNALVEVGLPLLPRRHVLDLGKIGPLLAPWPLRPGFVGGEPAEQQQVLLEYLEHLLDSPGGRLPADRSSVQLPGRLRARTDLALHGLKAALPQGMQDYLQGRLLLGAGRAKEAQALLEAAAGSPQLAGRALAHAGLAAALRGEQPAAMTLLRRAHAEGLRGRLCLWIARLTDDPAEAEARLDEVGHLPEVVLLRARRLVADPTASADALVQALHGIEAITAGGPATGAVYDVGVALAARLGNDQVVRRWQRAAEAARTQALVGRIRALITLGRRDEARALARDAEQRLADEDRRQALRRLVGPLLR